MKGCARAASLPFLLVYTPRSPSLSVLISIANTIYLCNLQILFLLFIFEVHLLCFSTMYFTAVHRLLLTGRVSFLLGFRVLPCMVFPVAHHMRLKKQYLSGNEKSYTTLRSLVYFMSLFPETLKGCFPEMKTKDNSVQLLGFLSVRTVNEQLFYKTGYSVELNPCYN